MAGAVTWGAVRLLLEFIARDFGWIEIALVAVLAEAIFLSLFLVFPGSIAERKFVRSIFDRIIKMGRRRD